MKVLFVFNHKAPYKVSLFNGLSKSIDLTVIFERESAKDRNAAFYNEKECYFKEIVLKNGYIGKENSFSFALKKYIKKHYKEFDLIIMNGYSTFSEMIAFSYMIKHHIPYCFYINGGIKKKNNFIKRYIKTKIIKHASYYFSPSVFADPYLIDLGADKNKILHYTYSTIYENEIQLEPFDKAKKVQLLKNYNLPTNGKIFVTTGQFIPRKNNMELLKIFALRKESLVFIGDGKEKEKYLNYIKKYHLGNVYFVPFLQKKQLLKLLPCFDYFISLSKEDIYGHMINEALAMGLPTISSKNVIAAQKLIVNGVNGYIVDINDEESIIKAINNIDKINRDEVIKKAKENTIEKSIQNHLELFKEITK